MHKPVVAVVVLNYNGKKLLQQFLPSVISNSVGADVFVADNFSTDGSVNYLKKEFPQVKTIQLDKNHGFAQGYNEALKQVEADYFVLVNSDMEVTPNWIEPIIDLMEKDKTVSACQPKILSYNAKDEFEYAGACGGFIDKYSYPFCSGRIFNSLEKDNGQYNTTEEIFWASGACMFVRANIFNELKGFDGNYFAHMEEIDLCWRMKNLGNRIMAVPVSVVYHVGGGTLNKLSPKKTFLNFRNNLITLTKNYPNSNWFFIVVARLELDGIAGIKFLLEGRPLHTWAVVRAHFAYYFSFPRVFNQRKELKANKNYKASFSKIYCGSIVIDYYLRKIKAFSQLKKSRFN